MNRTIGILVIAFVSLVLLLFTCMGSEPDSPADAGGSETSVSERPVPDPGRSVDTDPPVRETGDRSVAGPQLEGSRNREPAEESSEHIADARPLGAPASVVPRPTDRLPVPGIEALLAVSPRSLEGGTEEPFLLVPADSLRDRLRLPISDDPAWIPIGYTQGQPASTINTPTAYGPQWGDVFAGVGYQERIRYDDWQDGVASVGFGLGNSDRYAGLDVTVHVLDTYNDFAKDRSLSLKLHRRLPYRSAVAIGHENVWHTDGTDGGSSRYAVVSKILFLRDRPTSALGSVVMNVGIGTDRFLPERQFAAGDGGVNVFGGAAIRVLRPVNAVANWTGQDLALGVSIAPVRRWPLVVTPAIMDVTGAAGDGARFSMSAGLSYNFRR